MFMVSRHKARKSIAVLLVALIAGCNGASSDGNVSSGYNGAEPTPPSADSLALSAENTVSSSRSMYSSHVLLQGKIHSSSNDGTNVVSLVEPVTELESCQDIVFDSTGYTVSFDDFVGVCVYKYYAENSAVSEQQASAYAVSVSQRNVNSEVEMFSPISETTFIGETLTIDLKNEDIAAQVPSGYQMDESVTVIGDGEATADTTKQTITYNPIQEGGFATIIYSYSNESEVKLGSISVSVSSSTNTGPEAEDFDYSKEPGAVIVNTGQEVTIDLSNHVSDADENPLQLISTESWNAAVSPVNPQDMDNLKLTFQTSKVGEHFVSYVVSDHYGGYATAMIRVEVHDPDLAPSWGNLNLDMKYYSAPLVKSDADAQGVEYVSTHIDSGAQDANVVTMNFAQAKKLCAATGRLPKVDELNALSNIGGVGPANYDSWPVEIGYWANDNGNAISVDLSSGEPNDSLNAGGQYVTCVSEGGYEIDRQNSQLTAVSNGEDQATVRVHATLNGQPAQGIELEAQVDGQAQVINAPTTDENGYATFQVIDTLAETVTFTTNVLNSSSTRSIELHFTGNPNTAKLTLTPTKNHQSVTATNIFQAKLTDANDTPLVGQNVSYSTSELVVLNPDSQQTNDLGQQSVGATLRNPNVTDPVPYTVVGSYTRPDSSIATATISMQFETNRLSNKLISTKDNSMIGLTNIVTAKFDQLTSITTNDVVTFTIEGDAVFAANQNKTISINPDFTNKQAVASITTPTNLPSNLEIAYTVQASYYDQQTERLNQRFKAALNVESDKGTLYQFPADSTLRYKDIDARCREYGLQPTQNYDGATVSVAELQKAGWERKDYGYYNGSGGPLQHIWAANGLHGPGSDNTSRHRYGGLWQYDYESFARIDQVFPGSHAFSSDSKVMEPYMCIHPK